MIKKEKGITTQQHHLVITKDVQQQGIRKREKRTQPNDDKRTLEFSGYILRIYEGK